MTLEVALQTLSPAKIDGKKNFFLNLKFLEMVLGHTANKKKSTQENLKYDKNKK